MAIAVIVCGLTPGARAGLPTTSPAFEARLDAVDAKSESIVALRADFVQEKKSPLLRKPLVSRGTVQAKGGASLWQTREPEPSVMASTPHLLRLYFPARRVVEEYPVHGQLGVMAASPLPGLAAVRQNFTLTPDDGVGLAGPALAAPATPADTLAVRLVPRGDDLKQFVDHVRVLLDAARGVVLAFEMTDPDGEVTLIRFDRIDTDPRLPDDALTLKPPAGTPVVRPLGDTGAAPR